MKKLDWNKINQTEKFPSKADQPLAGKVKSKKVTLVVGPIHVSRKRINQIISKESDSSVIFGVLKDEWVPGLENCLQFSPLNEDELQRAIKLSGNVTVLSHFHKDVKYIIKEMQPGKVIFINGSWKGQIHYTSMYWKAIDVGARIELTSPFASEREAKRFEKSVSDKLNSQMKKLGKKRNDYAAKELLQMTEYVAKCSWDWIGQIGAVLAKKGKVLATGFNRVLPYQAYQMHEGSIRERLQIPAQEMIETQLTNHAECEVLEEVREKKLNIAGATLYINMFPCPVCAKILARTDIREIIYSQDHNLGNDIGYKILQMSGKKLKRLVL